MKKPIHRRVPAETERVLLIRRNENNSAHESILLERQSAKKEVKNCIRIHG